MFRTAAGVGLRQLARKVGVSPAYLSLVETGKAPPPSPVRAFQIAKALDMRPEALVSLTGRVDPEVLDILTRLPESGELVRAASVAGLSGREIAAIARAMTSCGKRLAREAMEEQESSAPAENRKTVVDNMLAGMVFPRLPCRTRADLFDFLTREVVRGNPSLDRETLLSTLLERESGNSTAFGDGVAIPHARIKGLEKPVLAFGRSAAGIEYPGGESGPVRLVFLLLSPPDGNSHLETLANIARACGKPETRDRLLTAKGRSGLARALREELGVTAEFRDRR